MKTIDLSKLRVDVPSAHLASIPSALSVEPSDELILTICEESQAKGVLRWVMPIDWIEVLEESSQALDSDEKAGIFVLYSQKAHDQLSFREQMNEAHTQLASLGKKLKDAFQVSDGRYWSYLCEGCCDPAGKEVQTETQDSLKKRELREIDSSAWKALEELVDLASEGKKAESLRSVICSSVQDVNVRDYILSQIVQSDEKSNLLISALQVCLKSALSEERSRVAGMVAAAMAACDYPKEEIKKIIKQATDDSLALLVNRGIETRFPAEALSQIFVDAASKITITK